MSFVPSLMISTLVGNQAENRQKMEDFEPLLAYAKNRPESRIEHPYSIARVPQMTTY